MFRTRIVKSCTYIFVTVCTHVHVHTLGVCPQVHVRAQGCNDIVEKMER